MDLKYIEDRKDLEEDYRYRYIDLIAIDDVHKLVIDCLNAYSTEEKLKESNKVGDLLFFMLKEKNLYAEGVAHQTFIDALLAATLLHNICYEYGSNWVDIFNTRDTINGMAEQYQSIPESFIDMVISTIENQLGESMPIKGCRPNPNTPGELFAWAVSITKKYIQ